VIVTTCTNKPPPCQGVGGWMQSFFKVHNCFWLIWTVPPCDGSSRTTSMSFSLSTIHQHTNLRPNDMCIQHTATCIIRTLKVVERRDDCTMMAVQHSNVANLMCSQKMIDVLPSVYRPHIYSILHFNSLIITLQRQHTVLVASVRRLN
jgi:hypothetical protein